MQAPIAEVPGQRQPTVDHRDGLGRAERAAGRLELGLAILRLAVAQFSKDRDHAADLRQKEVDHLVH